MDKYSLLPKVYRIFVSLCFFFFYLVIKDMFIGKLLYFFSLVIKDVKKNTLKKM